MKPFGKHVRNYYLCVRTICEPSDGCQLYVTVLYLLMLYTIWRKHAQKL